MSPAHGSTAHPEVTLDLRGRLGEDELDGLELYNQFSSSPSPWESVKGSWADWFRENPFGQGSFAVAKCEGRVVGFYALIPTQMRINGRVLVGGKGEFLVVAPRFRRARIPNTDQSLPVALVSSLNKTVRDFGMEFTFGVPNPAAAICNLMAGAKPMPVKKVEHVTFFRRPTRSLHQSAVKNLILGLGVVGYTSARRGIVALKGSRAEVAPGDPAQLSGGPDDDRNLLVHESREMLAFRFRGTRHWTYTVAGAGGATSHLVFTTYPEDVRLAHWTNLGLDFDSWACLCREVSSRARREGYSNLRIELPDGPESAAVDFGKLGFVSRMRQDTIYLHSPDRKLMVNDTRQWRLTNSHVGYY